MAINKETTESEEKMIKKELRKKLFIHLFTLFLFILSVTLAWIWYGWQLPVVLILFLWGNNLDQRNQRNRKMGL